MSTLSGKRPSETFPFLLQINGGVGAALQPVLDGSGNVSALSVGADSVRILGNNTDAALYLRHTNPTGVALRIEDDAGNPMVRVFNTGSSVFNSVSSTFISSDLVSALSMNCNDGEDSTITLTGSNGHVTAAQFIGGGASLTGLNATNLSSGTVSDTRLSSNIPRKNAPNTFTDTIACQGIFSSAGTFEFQDQDNSAYIQGGSGAITIFTMGSNIVSDSSGLDISSIHWGVNVGGDASFASLNVGGAGALASLDISSGAIVMDNSTLTVTTMLLLPGLPTSDPAFAGQVWNDGGTLKISAG
jgi:hypothetical protein